jgi:hypothetical protein
MSLQEQYPDFANFLISYLSDPADDDVDDTELVQEFLSENSQELISLVASQGRKVLEAKIVSWEEVSTLANRYFLNSDNVYEWLSRIVLMLES